MNYDGQAIVTEVIKINKNFVGDALVTDTSTYPSWLNRNPNTFKSVSTVRPDKDIIIIPNNKYSYSDEALVDNPMDSDMPTFPNISKANYSNLDTSITPYEDNQYNHYIGRQYHSYIDVLDIIKVHYFPFQLSDSNTVRVIDKTCYNILNQISFRGVTINVINKAVVEVPEVAEIKNEYSLIVQKDEYFEMEFKKPITTIVDKPDELEFDGTIIKAVFKKAGEYFFTIIHSDNSKDVIQLLVPFYKRIQ